MTRSPEAPVGLIDAEEVADLALALAQIDSPPGREQAVADAAAEWLDGQGVSVRQLGMFPDRQNVVGVLRGRGTGRSIVFNAHMDTAWGPEERRWMHAPDDPVYRTAWREGDRLIGNGIVNDKGPLAAALVALAALRRSGVELAGEVLVVGVCGEIGQEPVDEFTAPAYLSKEVGTRFLIDHGVVADCAVVAENTNFGIATVEAGKAFFKVTVLGERSRYTPYVDNAPELADHGNAVLRAAAILDPLLIWARRYEERYRYDVPGGSCVPKVNVGAVRGGQPFIPITTPERCYLYLDVRLVPGQTAMDVQRELRGVLAASGIPVELECTLYRRGYEAAGADEVLAALRGAHQAEFGSQPGGVSPGQSSSWRDTNPYNEVGIPAVSYGPSAGMGGSRAWTTVEDLHRAARVYARTALAVAWHDDPAGGRP